VPPVLAPWSLACQDHVEYGNVPCVAGECISALNPVVGHQQPSCGKSLEALGQCFMGQSIEFGQVIGAERTLARVSCQVLRSEETVTCSPSQQHKQSRWSGLFGPTHPVATSLSRGAIGPEATGLGTVAAGPCQSCYRCSTIKLYQISTILSCSCSALLRPWGRGIN
jgi:hypothetical protein